MSASVVSRFVPVVARRAAAPLRWSASASASASSASYSSSAVAIRLGGSLQQNKPCARRSFASSTSLLAKKYTEDHEWIELDADGKTGTIGITEYAAQQLGDVVYVELPEIGAEVKQGDAIGAVESVKSASDILTPVSGTVVEHNQALEEKPGDINRAPEAGAWLAKIEIADPAELDALLDKDSYTKFTQEAEE